MFPSGLQKKSGVKLEDKGVVVIKESDKTHRMYISPTVFSYALASSFIQDFHLQSGVNTSL